ncbi:hypothetical protein MUGA111182_03695 [Mucilaginibacter galii]|uniref:Uncharacterized protein n=1 Tax=Mucilaginibacter galii TaxID=2005073 RepID=A0A917JAR3_9SPHI|nr:hypothetical protein [Mucilaginibacter galii]GGI51015.1 hypothetical protein GCM10011425_22270 [Mucilaginibacter galii]
MKKCFTAVILFFLSCNLYAQSSEDIWAKWNKSYAEVNLDEMLKSETLYADSVEKQPNIPQYYFRVDKYRFKAKYLGKTRSIDTAVARSMQNVNNLSTPSANNFEKLLGSELLFQVGSRKIWMSLQPQMLDAFRQEVKVNGWVTLYCLYLNEHNSQKKLYNNFLISEFITL